MVFVDFLPFNKSFFIDFFAKLRNAEKVIIFPLLFVVAFFAAAGRHRKSQVQRKAEQVVYERGFTGARWCRNDDGLSFFHYMIFRICSLIFSSSSFISTTNRWISVWFALLPMVLISRPISWQIKPSFFPCPGASFSVSVK